MRKILFSTVFALAVLAQPAASQLFVGLHAAKMDKTADGAWGGGAQIGVDLPALPLDVVASGEYFDVDCLTDCSFYGGSVDARFRLPLPVVRPYGTAGLTARKFEVEGLGEGDWETGLGIGAGVDVATPLLRIFVEGRYEFVDSPDEQLVWRAGLIL